MNNEKLKSIYDIVRLSDDFTDAEMSITMALMMINTESPVKRLSILQSVISYHIRVQAISMEEDSGIPESKTIAVLTSRLYSYIRDCGDDINMIRAIDFALEYMINQQD